MSKKAIWTIIVIVLIILGIWWAVSNNDATEVDNDDDSTGLQVEDNAIVAVDQKPSDEILVSEVNFEEGGFVVIHQTNEDGSPGEVLGVSEYLSAGSHTNLEIAVEEEPADETELIAMLHSDNGDRVFNIQDDDPILSDLGGPIMMRFMIDTAAGENFDVKL